MSWHPSVSLSGRDKAEGPAMAVKVRCACRKALHASESLAGQSVTCPSCGATLTIPAPRKPKDFAAPAAADPAHRPPARMSPLPWITAGALGALAGIFLVCLRG